MMSSHLEEEDYDDVDLGSSKKGKGTGQKGNSRSKHSETEQRRRLKINEKFQVLMDLIPQNEQKRDKASFLLEVIQYVQFLQSKLDMYEGWTQEPSKLVPRRNSIGPGESFTDQPQLMRNGSAEEDSYIVTPSMLINAQNSVSPEMVEAVTYKTMDQSAISANQAIPMRAVTPSTVIGNVPNQPFHGSHSRSQFWQPCTTESDLPSYALNEEDLRTESGEASVSNAYSQRLLNNLSQALQSSGVDLMQASISVQLDVGRRSDTQLPSTVFNTKDHQNHCEPSDRAAKRPRT